MELIIILLCVGYVSVQSFINGFLGRWRERREHQRVIDEAVAKSYDMYGDRHTTRRYQREDRYHW